jgi:hypothetical protein
MSSEPGDRYVSRLVHMCSSVIKRLDFYVFSVNKNAKDLKKVLHYISLHLFSYSSIDLRCKWTLEVPTSRNLQTVNY